MTDRPSRRLPERNKGLTGSEQRLEQLCRETFLSLWSYPGVCKDQGSGGGRKGGKEICDVLVVFENDIIIFSDKTCAFPATGDLSLDWSRWYDRAVVSSARQLRGAERWLREHPDRLFLDRQCQHPFPFDLPRPPEARFHRVLVAGGASRRCIDELGGNGSLMVSFGESRLGTPDPFVLAPPDDALGFIHVFDHVTLGIALGAMNTISDFVGYLTAKEELAGSRQVVMATGEEELIARYLKHTDSSGRHAFQIPKKFNGVFLDEGGWQEFQTNPQRLAKLEADKVSHAWDALIERFAHFAATGASEFANYSEIRDFERGIRFLAREPRVKRRILADALIGIMAKAKPGQERTTRIVMPFEQGDPHYVFLSLLHPGAVSHEAYRRTRREMLAALCMATRARWPDALDIVGIATEPLQAASRSEDLVYLDGRAWDRAAELEAEAARERYGLFEDLRFRQTHDKEYPSVPNSRPEPVRRTGLNIGRNELCPCRSGRKFKRCCGRLQRSDI